jgi:hypothetical protein
VRKVALALCYGILKAGAVQSETLFSTAGELVPLIVSHLDDSEVTPRQMACLCVTVLFERLRGAFSEQSIHEIYPKLGEWCDCVWCRLKCVCACMRRYCVRLIR